MELPELDESAFRPIMNHLNKKHIQMLRSKTFGIIRIPSTAPGISKHSYQDPELYHLLMKFALLFVNIPFTTVQISASSVDKESKIKHSKGPCYTVAFGQYTGGELVLKNSADVDVEYNIHRRPMVFDPTSTEHYAKEFKGKRWTMVYYTLAEPLKFPCTVKLSDFDPVVVDGVWSIAWRREGRTTVYLNKKNGLPQSIKSKKSAPIEEPDESDPNLSGPQNLMILARKRIPPP